MAQTLLRKSVAALARTREIPTPDLRPLDAVVAELQPHEPVHALRPATLARTAAHFVAGFPGETLYAVKCNADPRTLRALWDGGVRGFDCASPAEIALVRSMFGRAATIAYMHPVRARAAIREAYGRHAVRRFVLDSVAEFDKIREETAAKPGTLDLIVRIAPPVVAGADKPLHDLSGKFGASAADAVALLRRVRPFARTLGISFHVGSQNADPQAFARAIAHADALAREAGVAVEVLDVGGGFPVAYPGQEVPPIDAFFAAIKQAHAACHTLANTALWAEPGRALVAAGGSVVVQVQARRGNTLYINDGVYGALADAGVPGLRYPTRLLRASAADTVAYDFYGPTCDSADHMKGPFVLPGDVCEGDWIELGQLGAYGAVLRTGFNGFERAHLIEVEG
ncbi:MAG: type III PLP-dependent enzyme [Magnetospirillum sp.]|nr:type III PLP-dependent enzyme [Magnetospirillum sp.]